MMKRDLKADLERCTRFGKLVEMGWYKLEAAYTVESVREILDFAPAASEGWPHAIERAIKAESLVQELVGVIDDLCGQINQCGLDEQMWEVYRKAKEMLGDE